MRKIANVEEDRHWSHSINGRVFDIQMKIIKLQLSKLQSKQQQDNRLDILRK
jgi:hypothetical protein